MARNIENLFQLRQSPAITGSTAKDQDREAFLTYLLPVKKYLFNFIRKALNFSPDADDIFQEALLKGFRYFHSFDRRKNFKTWIFTIAHNLMKDMFREKHLRHWPVSLEEAGEPAIENVCFPISVSQEVREIYAAAAHLKPRQREVFFLFYYNEFSIPEIAEITGLTRTNIKFILHQARSAVKKVLEVHE